MVYGRTCVVAHPPKDGCGIHARAETMKVVLSGVATLLVALLVAIGAPPPATALPRAPACITKLARVGGT